MRKVENAGLGQAGIRHLNNYRPTWGAAMEKSSTMTGGSLPPVPR